MSELKIINTDDGSSSLYVPRLNETYHSFHGAVTESKHVFIQNGLDYFIEQHSPMQIHILEVGMGTGLNVLLTMLAVKDRAIDIKYSTLEPYPIPQEIVDNLKFPSLFRINENRQLFHEIHSCEWDVASLLLPNFELNKLKARLEDFEASEPVNIIYFDAFAPNKQAELWTEEILFKCKECLSKNGILVTYCAQGQFKRNLRANGFRVESLPGPPGKMEMVRAIENSINI